MILTIDNIKNRIADFVHRTWGVAVLRDRKERASRIVEEAIELAQAEGVDSTIVTAITTRVYSRPVGLPSQEGAGVRLTWLAWCSTTFNDPVDICAAELERIEALPADHFRKKHADKVAVGASQVEGTLPEQGASITNPCAWDLGVTCPVSNGETVDCLNHCPLCHAPVVMEVKAS
jgi:hypothetical protein